MLKREGRQHKREKGLQGKRQNGYSQQVMVKLREMEELTTRDKRCKNKSNLIK